MDFKEIKLYLDSSENQAVACKQLLFDYLIKCMPTLETKHYHTSKSQRKLTEWLYDTNKYFSDNDVASKTLTRLNKYALLSLSYHPYFLIEYLILP